MLGHHCRGRLYRVSVYLRFLRTSCTLQAKTLRVPPVISTSNRTHKRTQCLSLTLHTHRVGGMGEILAFFGSSCQLVAKMALCRYQCFAHWLMLVLCLHSFLINDALSPMPAKLEQCTHLCKQFIQSTAYLFFHRCQRFSLSATQSASNSFH